MLNAKQLKNIKNFIQIQYVVRCSRFSGCESEILEIVRETKTQIIFKMNSISPEGKVSE